MPDTLSYGGKTTSNRSCNYTEKVLYSLLKSSEVGFDYSYLFIKCLRFPQGALLKPHIPLLVIALLESLSGLEDQV